MKLLSLALGMFAVGVDGFVVAGILRPISSDLGVSVASAGLLETSFALSIAVLAPLLVTALGSGPPRLTLTASLAAFTVFNILAAVSPWFWLLLVARVLAGLSVGVFQAVAPMVASMTAPKDGQGSALAVVTSGMTAGIVLGVPIGIFVTNQFDWRFSFWLVALLGAVAAIACSTQFAEVPGPPPTPLRERVSVAAHPSVLLMLGSITVWMLGGYVLYVFMGPMLQGVANVSGSALPWIFFGFGVASVVGNLAGGRALDRWGAAAALIIGLTGGGPATHLSDWRHSGGPSLVNSGLDATPTPAGQTPPTRPTPSPCTHVPKCVGNVPRHGPGWIGRRARPAHRRTTRPRLGWRDFRSHRNRDGRDSAPSQNDAAAYSPQSSHAYSGVV